eukprot:4997956-Prymnesium_polylepis.1
MGVADQGGDADEDDEYDDEYETGAAANVHIRARARTRPADLHNKRRAVIMRIASGASLHCVRRPTTPHARRAERAVTCTTRSGPSAAHHLGDLCKRRSKRLKCENLCTCAGRTGVWTPAPGASQLPCAAAKFCSSDFARRRAVPGLEKGNTLGWSHWA